MPVSLEAPGHQARADDAAKDYRDYLDGPLSGSVILSESHSKLPTKPGRLLKASFALFNDSRVG